MNLSQYEDKQRDEDDAIDREWCKHLALLRAIGMNLPVEEAKRRSLAATNGMHVALGLVPLEPPL